LQIADLDFKLRIDFTVSRPFLSFALLNFNEEATLELAARRAWEALAACGRTFELVLVDDGSTDSSANIISHLAGELPHCRAIFHGRNLGIGAGIRTCYFATRGQWATWFPADLQAEPRELFRLLECLDDCDVLATYRRPRTRQASLARRAVSSLDRLLVRLLFGVAARDLHWIRFFRRELLDRMSPRLQSPAIDTEMLLAAVRLRARIRDEPLDDLPRTAGVARGASPRNLLRAARETLGLRLRGPGLIGAGEPSPESTLSASTQPHAAPARPAAFSGAPPVHRSRAA
jgi:glycosyltransferase involved in cell wall biosynthesis